MTSRENYKEAFVWIWLPGETQPVVAGLLTTVDKQIVFNYGRSYIARKNAIPIYEPELPLGLGIRPLLPGLSMPNCIRDAAPDAWGRRVIINKRFGSDSKTVDAVEFGELTYLLESGSDRTGALDFQQSSTDYVPREGDTATLDDLLSAAERIEKGMPLSVGLNNALLHASSIGGARPKATITSEDKKFIAKFPLQSDLYSMVKAEFVAMRLASEAGINTAKVRLRRAAGKDVLLIERFDREADNGGWLRRAMVSALTLLELDEMMARYASYEDLATTIRHRFREPKGTLKDLFARMVFNVLCGNTDDHARNHSAFWDGHSLSLTPAYDICPQARAGNEASQAMLIVGQERLSQIAVCLKAARAFLLNNNEALTLIANQIQVIRQKWELVCEEAKLDEIDRNLLRTRQFLNEFAFVGAPPSLQALRW